MGRWNMSEEEQEKVKRFESAQANLLEGIPSEFQEFIRATAWDLGHAYGYEEVLSYVSDFVSGLSPAIKDFQNRLTKGL